MRTQSSRLDFTRNSRLTPFVHLFNKILLKSQFFNRTQKPFDRFYLMTLIDSNFKLIETLQGMKLQFQSRTTMLKVKILKKKA